MALTKVYKEIDSPTGKLIIYGSNRDIQVRHAKPEWGKDLEPCFYYRGSRYFLSEFMAVEKHSPKWMQEFHGYASDSFFSGVLVKVACDEETVKAYTYIG